MARTKSMYAQKQLMLTANLLDQELRDRLENQTKVLATPDQAIDFMIQEQKKMQVASQLEKSDWKFLWLSEVSFRTGILSYKGTEVALYFRRQTTETRSDPDAPTEAFQAKTLRTKEEAWIRVSLLEAKSALKQAQFFSEEFTKLKEQADTYKSVKESQSLLIDQLSEKVGTLERALESEKSK